MATLGNEDRQCARQFNMRARQLFWRGVVPESNALWRLDDDGIVDWTLDYQEKHGLLADGRFGPACLITMMAESLGGIGGFIIGGREIAVEGVRVARMFSPSDGAEVKPDLCCILSVPELDYACRERVNGRGRVRAHFSIDSSMGTNGCSTVIQWADPLRAVPFCPSFETVDYPRRRDCVGVEIENVLLLYQLDSDERRWMKRRPVVKAKLGNREINQPVFYPQQMKALEAVLDVLEKHAGIPRTFPNAEGVYTTSIVEDENLAGYCGCLAKFHYISMNNEPGAGLVPWLEELFGKLEPVEHKSAVEAAVPAVAVDMSAFEERRKELEGKPQPTSTFSPDYEDGPRFNLANAVAAAYASGKVARAGRIADRARKYDET